ncbi:aminoacetone oxidase family FAD-binding enzyme [Nibricoccus aquaticus]|uniref:Aminoacetone oxidase family FAD-binding enzyme n=1 Tax=Nibricoccus aquaticus TaxID=2576891 RepID=A0A290QKX0_9BACT|nr:NAD(P)/FAD-dependent oxidoreductase [Nibricoccus aquaticus]ATC66018.1 aminoacetone oxidase family FAD-binding enzyme [Nibricoccus aquaticus]
MKKLRAVIAGGGAAGFFAAITCAETNPDAEVILLESSPALLAKVKISGGGRCNVTHACFDPRELVKRYPRGSRELLGAFHRWQPRDTVAWFAARGVQLKTEPDGRMFPTTDDSQTIIDCLQLAAKNARVQIRTRTALTSITRSAPSSDPSTLNSQPSTPPFLLTLSTGETLPCDKLLLATGGPKISSTPALAVQLGHTVEPPVPSLFTFNIADPRLVELAGLSVAETITAIRDTKLRETGPLLVTHWGVSGPAILKLSAWGARELHARDYRFTLLVNWLAGKNADAARADLAAARTAYPRRQVATASPFATIPQRLWERLVIAAGLAPDAIWTSVSNDRLSALAAQLTAAEFGVTGKSTNKDEFVTCGGVRLSEVDFKTMQSRLVPGLHFAGEALDIDGITGGFNFQAAWTTGHLAGLAMAGHP